jgi:lysozyme
MKHLCVGMVLIALFVIGSCEDIGRFSRYGVHGIDVSHYQAAISWDCIARQNMSFAFVKATEGATFQDTLFCFNWEEMKRVEMKRGAYHFFRPRTPAHEQARHFTELVEMKEGDLPPVLDVEVLDGVSKVQLITAMRTWLYLVELKYNIKPIIYTNIKFYNKYLAGHFAEYPLWIARYNTREPVLACGRDWLFWQYGSQGRIEGIDGFVDFNVFNGTHEDLNNLCLTPTPILSLSPN